MIKIGIIGFGTVGQGFLEVLIEKGSHLPVKLVGIAGRSKGEVYCPEGINPQKALDCVGNGKSLNDCFPDFARLNPLELIEKGELDIIIEATPTNLETGEPAYTYIKTALSRGIDVITANKGPVALYFSELSQLKGDLRFEATVMSGTPVIGFIEENLEFAKIQGFRGILNGTTNFILTEMAKGRSYDDALREAQTKGFAETDPTADVEGFDALAKIVILANRFFGERINLRDVPRKGITGLTKSDDTFKWKLIATAIKNNGELQIKVEPEKVYPGDPFYNVDGTENAIIIKTQLLGDIMLRGPGAGRRETGYAVFLDLLKLLKVRGVL